MDILATIEQAESHFRAANFLESEALCKHLVNQNIRNFRTLQLLGLAQGMLGKIDEAIEVLESAIKKEKGHAGAYSNLGNFYLKAGRAADAINACKKAIKLDPDHIDAQINLGNALFVNRQFRRAEKAYLKSLKKQPGNLEARENLAQCLTHKGRLKEAAEQCQQVIQLAPSRSQTYIQLLNVLMLMHSTEDAELVIDSALANHQADPGALFELLIGKAKLAWLTGKLELLSEILQATRSIFEHCDDYPNIKNLRIYHRLLDTLLEIRKQHWELYEGRAEKVLLFVGESHCLAPSETFVNYHNESYRILAALITGCKAWHLGKKAPNQFKASLSRLFRSLPEQSLVVLAFGEIDCRSDEGILSAFLEKGIDYRESIPGIISRYIDFAVREAETFRHRLIFYGVPAASPIVSQRLTVENAKPLSAIIHLFNQTMSLQCSQRKVEFLDVYAATVPHEGRHNLPCHIDDYHLHPKTVPALFLNNQEVCSQVPHTNDNTSL